MHLASIPKETQIKSKTVVRYISRSPRVPRVARCIEGCERETLDKTTSHPTKLQTTAAKSLVITTNGLNLRFPNEAAPMLDYFPRLFRGYMQHFAAHPFT